MKKPVTQEHDYGCGVACVAFVTGVPYQQVVNLLNRNKTTSQGFLCKDLVVVLDNLGYPYNFKYLKPRLRIKIYREGTIIFIKRSKQYPAGHYLVRYEDQWMDPWINLPFSKNIELARSGFRKRLPGKPIYAILPL
jgi:hypothetical protein